MKKYLLLIATLLSSFASFAMPTLGYGPQVDKDYAYIVSLVNGKTMNTVGNKTCAIEIQFSKNLRQLFLTRVLPPVQAYQCANGWEQCDGQTYTYDCVPVEFVNYHETYIRCSIIGDDNRVLETMSIWKNGTLEGKHSFYVYSKAGGNAYCPLPRPNY